MSFRLGFGSSRIRSFLWVRLGLDGALTLLSIAQTLLNPDEAVESSAAGSNRLLGDPVVS